MTIRLSMLLMLAAPLCAQSRNHARTAPAPTVSAIPPAEAPAPPPAPLTPAESPAQRATIAYAAGQLTISASNSSLNSILREVSRLTGITITGGVAEERVFGDYGPAQPAEVLGKLLDGTASNMLFVSSVDGKAPELVLTPRTGGVTPPNPNASRFDDAADSDDEPRRPIPSQGTESQSRPANQNPVATPITPAPAQGDTNAASPQPATPAADPSQSPNGVKTPQQIYDELMRLRRQQQTQPQ